MSKRDLARATNAALDSAEAVSRRPLEEYLRALLGLLRSHRGDAPSIGLFARLLQEAFSVPALAFDDRWLAYDAPPD
jgi:hypothetical protein